MRFATSLLLTGALICLCPSTNAKTTFHRTIEANFGAAASETPASLKTTMESAIRNMEDGRYNDASDACQQAVQTAPDCALTHEIRGTLALWLGSKKRAAEDFASAEKLSPTDPMARYGRSIAAIMSGENASQRLRDLLNSEGLSPEQQGDIATAAAYLAFVNHDMTQCAAYLDKYPASDSTREELAAMLLAHKESPEAIGALTKFLATPSGVPRVIEEAGVRTAYLPLRGAVEPSIGEPTLRQMYTNRFEQTLRNPRTSADAAPVSGTVAISAPGTPAANGSVTLTVDGDVAAITNKAPYTFNLDTRRYSNGTHLLRVAAQLDEGGSIDLLTRRIRITNQNAAPAANDGGLGSEAYQDFQMRIWKLLRLRPSRRLAEGVLAKLQARAGDHSEAATHLLTAVALDPLGSERRDVGQMILRAERTAGRHAAPPIAVRSGSPYRKWVTLTFDDGPNPKKTPALLDALAAAKAPATFFIVGSRAELAPDLIRRMASEGHDVENHSYTHPNIAQCLPSTVESEILRTSIVIRSLTGRYPFYFRPPGGNASPTLAKLASAYGVSLAFWSIDAISAEYAGSPDGLVDFVMKRVGNGSVILMHNGIDTTTNAVPKLVATLRAHGYKIVTLRQMMADK